MKLSRDNVSKCIRRVIKHIDWIVLSIVGVFCYCYSLFWSHFAEINIQFSFLNFPIFIGEILLVFCVLAFLIKWKSAPIKRNRWHSIVTAYTIFVLIKAFHGYSKWGPLAFRNAALFYYPLFMIIGYYFYRSDFFRNKFVNYGLLSLLIVPVFFQIPYKTFYFNYFILTIVLFMGIRNRKVRLILIALFIATCYRGIRITVWGSRGILVSSFIGYSFIIIISAIFFFKIKPIHKRMMGIFVTLCIALLFWNIGDKGGIKSLLSWNRLVENRNKWARKVAELEANFEFSNPPVKIYEPNYEPISGFWSKFTADLTVEEREELQRKRLQAAKLQKEIPVVDFQELEKDQLIEIIVEEQVKELAAVAVKKGKAGEELLVASLLDLKKEELIKIITDKGVSEVIDIEPPAIPKPEVPETGATDSVFINNILYRWVMYEDMFKELLESRRIFGLDFGKPFRSKTIDIMGCDQGWKTRVGWNQPHNGYVDIIYRSGVIGLLFIVTVWALFIRMIIRFIRARSVRGIFLSSSLLYWLVVTNFMVILELPHWAIPFWSLFGMTLRYCNIQREQQLSAKKAQ